MLTRKTVKETVLPELGQQVKRMRKAAGLTQEWLAHCAGVSTTFVHRFEYGKSDSISLYVAFMNAINNELRGTNND